MATLVLPLSLKSSARCLSNVKLVTLETSWISISNPDVGVCAVHLKGEVVFSNIFLNALPEKASSLFPEVPRLEALAVDLFGHSRDINPRSGDVRVVKCLIAVGTRQVGRNNDKQQPLQRAKAVMATSTKMPVLMPLWLSVAPSLGFGLLSCSAAEGLLGFGGFGETRGWLIGHLVYGLSPSMSF